jgi:hypothetical protein
MSNHKLEIKTFGGSVLYTYEDEQPTLKKAIEEAVLKRAYLGGADLWGANLRGANLRGADLWGAYLGGAYLGGANLGCADLWSANLGGADLRGANLGGANLRGANLRGADLWGADLGGAKEDFYKVLELAKAETPGLYKALLEGRIDGSQYEGECACLVGTIAKERKEKYNKLSIGLKPNDSRPSERLFLAIRKGDTPDNNPISAIVKDWMEAWMGSNGVEVPRRQVVWS